jgi:hypothetical protein
MPSRFQLAQERFAIPLSVAYADPPYPGCANLYPEKSEVDHRGLVADLCRRFPDGWALSTSTPALREVLALCPAEVRVAAWVKPFASFKPNVNPGYCWEPVIFMGGRGHVRADPTIRDFHSENITLKKGMVGAKPPGFCRWVFDLLGLRPGDQLADLYPGSGAVTEAARAYGLEVRALAWAIEPEPRAPSGQASLEGFL